MRITAANTVGAMLLLPALPAGPIGNRFEHAVSPPHAEGVASRPILQARAARAESTRFDCQSGQASAGTIIAHRVVTALRMMAGFKFWVAHLGLRFAMLSIVCVCVSDSLCSAQVSPRGAWAAHLAVRPPWGCFCFRLGHDGPSMSVGSSRGRAYIFGTQEDSMTTRVLLSTRCFRRHHLRSQRRMDEP